MYKIPTCGGWYDNDGEFDCLYYPEFNCEDCLCNWYKTGGTINPETGVKHRYETCEKYFGKPEKYNYIIRKNRPIF